MQIGVFLQPSTLDEFVAGVRLAHQHGIRSVWISQVFGIDAMMACAIAGREVPDIRFGTGVVPTYPRHPLVMGSMARTTQQATGGRFTLGIGLSHEIVITSMLGMDWSRPVRHLREYLDILVPLAAGEPADAAGEMYTLHGALDVACDPVPVVVAALGTQLLTMAGRRTDGTVTWMTGHRTIAEHVAPTIGAAASGAGRSAPQIIQALPTCVTDDEAGTRGRLGAQFDMYGYLPSYRAMLDREGVAGPADVAVVGTEAQVRDSIEAAFEAGTTEFVAAITPGDSRTLDLIASLA